MAVKRVLISGYYGFGNLGDEALLRAIVQGLRRLEPAPLLTVASGDPARTAAAHGVRAVSRTSPTDLWRAILEADLVISGGGSLLQDVTGPWNIPYYAGLMAAAELLGKPVMVFAQGIGPIRGAVGRGIVRAVINRAAAVTVRDEGSRRLLSAMGVRRPVEVVADPVFLLTFPQAAPDPGPEGGAGAGDRRGRHAPERSVARIGVALRRRGLPAEGTRVLAEAFDHLARERDVRYVFFAMHAEEDGPVAQEVAAHMRARAEVRAGQASLDETAALIAGCDLVVGMRLHALILAALTGCPPVGLSYDPKVDEFLRDVGGPLAARLPDLPPAPALAGLLREAVDQRRALAAALVPRVDALRRRAQRTFEIAGRLLAAAAPPGR